MKNYFKSFWALALLISTAMPCLGQENAAAHLALGKIEPYEMEVTYNKTSHLIFPAAIRYVDLGSANLVAGKAEDAENVLRVKASVKEFETQTNFSVITSDGRFYSFNTQYSPSPEALSYDLQTMEKAVQRANGNQVLFEELGNITPSMATLIMQTIYQNDKRSLKHIGAERLGVQFTLKGLYIQDGKYFFHTQLANRTNVPFCIDFINFKVVDKKTARRTATQQRPIIPLRIYRPLAAIGAKTSAKNIFLLDQFTIADDKVLVIEIFEKNGGRHQVLELENSDLVKARLIDKMHLKF